MIVQSEIDDGGQKCLAAMEAWLQVFDGEFDAGHKEMYAIFNLNERIFRIL